MLLICSACRKLTGLFRRNYKLFNIQGHIIVPAFKNVIAADDNNAVVLQLLYEGWCVISNSHLPTLYLAEGFSGKIQTVIIDSRGIHPVPELQSTQEKADQ